MNGTMCQYFHWYYPDDGSLWKNCRDNANKLASFGITALWLPPAFKCFSPDKKRMSVGYDAYDLYDLGEFDQKGSVRTKYGTKEEYQQAIQSAHNAGLQIYTDIVLNHKAGADEKEHIMVRKVNPENRNEFISEPLEADAYTRYTFPGRNGKYSAFIWDHHCFSGLDSIGDEKGIFKIINEYGDTWGEVISEEKGNFDYLMHNDIEFRNPAVKEELKRWGKWYFDQVNFDGMRLDGVKHVDARYINEWVDHMRAVTGKEMFAVGEYWYSLPMMLKYIEATEGRVSLFDAPLQHNFFEASGKKAEYDLTGIFNDSLLNAKPDLAVTLVGNHDTQPLQAMEATVDDWFKPHAYALILLNEKGYPCIFYPDLFSASYKDIGQDGKEHDIFLPACNELEKLLCCRKLYAYGPQKNYFDDPHCIGWTRQGDDEHKNSGCAMLISNAGECAKKMEIGKQHAGKTFTDYLQKHPAKVTINEDGTGEFFVGENSVSVWVCK